ncbi:MAG: pantetheine-phosphate adenylyltransferase [Chloroflexi bacterium]|nr:pantetheine-phosphate adenylyltransferase [Chloroflexota bacterium]
MSSCAIYPGSFNPVHYGHLDIARRALRMFDRVVVAIYVHPGKPDLFTGEERLDLVREALKDEPRVRVASYDILTVDYAREIGAHAIVRGLRVFSDFELEFRMALANRRLAPEIEIVNFIAAEEHLHISSSTIREIASLGGDVSSMAPPHVVNALKRRFAELKAGGSQSSFMVSLED